MDPMKDYFSMPSDKYHQQAQWESTHWQNGMPSWDATAIARETPLWQYTAPLMNHGGNSAGYYPTQIPLSPSYTNPSSINSPLTGGFPLDARYIPQVVTPLDDNMGKSNRPVSLQLQQAYTQEDEMMDEDEDSDGCSWEPKVAIPRPVRPMHRRSVSASEVLLSKSAKRAHTVVEKNYRERLNDKISDLATYLFETSSDSRSKPSKSLVMTRAIERLKQLESRNSLLEAEVAKLKQRVAILDHVAATSANAGEKNHGGRANKKGQQQQNISVKDEPEAGQEEDEDDGRV